MAEAAKIPSNRRQSPRLGTQVPVLYDSQNLSLATTSVNLSAGGILLSTPLCDDLGTRAVIRFVDAQDDAITLPCEVVRLNRGNITGMALKFQALGGLEQRALQKMLAQAQAGKIRPVP